jgi:hypothetical protein
MPTYKELLLDFNWRHKRNEVVIRDRLICKNCNNNNLLHNYEITQGMKLLQGRGNTSMYILLGRGAMRNNETRYRIYLHDDYSYWQDGIKPTYLLFYHERLEQLPNTNILKPVAVRKMEASERVIFNDIPVLKLPLKELNPSLTWIFNSTLHVHHKYYQDGKKPWQYPNEALITLCWSCHQKEHKEKKIKWLDIHGNEIGQLTPCGRCCGTGELPEYYYVENGICFECRGARYKEFIVW